MKKIQFYLIIFLSSFVFSNSINSAEIDIYKKIDLFGEVLEKINKELEIKAADLQRKDSEFVARQEFDREKEINDNMIDQQRVAVSQEALRDKTRIAEDRIQTQRDIASLNARQKAN